MSVITIEHLTKDYGGNKGVFDLSFNVDKGEIFGFLGPNGAGKTTTIRHLLGLLNSNSGHCAINGLNCRTKQAEIQRELGYLPGEIALFDDMTGSTFLKFMRKLRGIDNTTRIDELIDMFELNPKGRIKRMSKGMKQKVAIVAAFMHNPSVLILDEPTSGLDPLMQNRFIQLIQEEKQKGSTIIMSSHSFEEVERTCDRAAIIKDGRLITIESVESLKSSRKKSYSITFETITEAECYASENPIVSRSNNIVKVEFDSDMQSFIAKLSTYRITAIDHLTQSLEDLFMNYYGKGGQNNV